MSKLLELHEERSRDVAQAREIINLAESEQRELTEEEQIRCDKLISNALSIKKSIDREQKLMVIESELNRSQGTLAGRADTQASQDFDDDEYIDPRIVVRRKLVKSSEYRRAFVHYIRTASPAQLERIVLKPEFRNLQADLDKKGGFWLSQDMSDMLIKFVDDAVYIRQWGTILESYDIGVPAWENDPSDAEWTAELSTGTDDTAAEFGKRRLQAKPLRKRIKVSKTLIRRLPNVQDFIVSRLGYVHSITQEKAYMTGNGANQPLGIFVNSADGIDTSRDVSAGNTTTSIGFDGLIAAKYTLKIPHRDRSRWLFHRDALSQIAQLKDMQGQYLWQPSKAIGEPDTILGIAAFESEFVPNTFTTGQYVGVLADFSWYWIADPLDTVVEILMELYAEKNQVGIITNQEIDGQPVLAEAFVRVQLA